MPFFILHKHRPRSIIFLILSLAACSKERGYEPDSSITEEGYVYNWFDLEGDPISHLVISANMEQSILISAGGSGADGLGCPDNFSTILTPDPLQPTRFILEVRHGFNIEGTCSGGFSTKYLNVNFPALAAGEYIVHFSAAIHPECKDFPCEKNIVFDHQVVTAEIPVEVRL